MSKDEKDKSTKTAKITLRVCCFLIPFVDMLAIQFQTGIMSAPLLPPPPNQPGMLYASAKKPISGILRARQTTIKF